MSSYYHHPLYHHPLHLVYIVCLLHLKVLSYCVRGGTLYTISTKSIHFVLRDYLSKSKQDSLKTPTMYHCYFTYFETETESHPRIDTTKSWNYPNLKAIMKDLNNIWAKEKVPLNIKEHPSGRVVISHNIPLSMGSLASLKLSPNLAYILGYTSEVIKHGQFLRFDENKEFLAPHEPKLFLDFCDEKIKSEYRSILYFVYTILYFVKYNVSVECLPCYKDYHISIFLYFIVYILYCIYIILGITVYIILHILQSSNVMILIYSIPLPHSIPCYY